MHTSVCCTCTALVKSMTASSSSEHVANEHTHTHTALPLTKLRPMEKVVPVPNEVRHVAVWKNLIGLSAHLEN